MSIITPANVTSIRKDFCNTVNEVPEHPEFYPRIQGEVLNVKYKDAEGVFLDLHINTHAGDNLYFGLIDAMRACKGETIIPFSKRIFGPSMHEEEGKDFHASGYGLSCAAVAHKGAVLLDGSIVTDDPQGQEVFTDLLILPVGADTAVPFHQSQAKVILFGGTTRDGFFFDGKLQGGNLSEFQCNCFAHEVWRWDANQQYPDYKVSTPLTDEKAIRREFAKKCRIDPHGAVLQPLKQRDSLPRRKRQWKLAEEQVTRAQQNGGRLILQPGEHDHRASLKNKKHKMKIMADYEAGLESSMDR